MNKAENGICVIRNYQSAHIGCIIMNKKSQNKIIKKPAIDFKVKRNDDGQLEAHTNFGEGAAFKTTGFKSIGAGLILSSTLNVFASLSAEALQIEGKKILYAMKELNPQNGFEGMLINQMVIVYKQAMDCFHLANDENNKKSMHIHEKFLNQGTKLMRLYYQQLEALDKHRRKGNQKMIVEHVHVHKGGQAIVGSVTQGGGVNNEK